MKTDSFRTLALLAVSILIAASGGCYQRTLAPELEYSAHDVTELREQVDEMEWE